jgi:tRNA(Ile)-lysidine synthase
VPTVKVLDAVRKTISEHQMLVGSDALVVGVSGGPDSLCLLHVLRELQQELGVSLHVGHLEHGIRGGDSQADAAYVESLVRGWGLPITVEHGDVPGYAAEHKLAIEEAARRGTTPTTRRRRF